MRMEVDEVIGRRRVLFGRYLALVLYLGLSVLGMVACGSASRTAAANRGREVPMAAPTSPPTTVRSVVAPSPRPASPTAVPRLPAVADLAQLTLAGKPLGVNGWAAKGVILTFRIAPAPGMALVPQVELVRADQTFRGAPTIVGDVLPSSGGSIQARVVLDKLDPGEYRWQARVEDVETKRAGPWTPFADGASGFGIVGSVPAIQRLAIQGAGHTVDGIPVANGKDHPQLGWSVSASPPVALDYLWLVADHQRAPPADLPSDGTRLPASARSHPLDALDDGLWYVHLWAVDRAGQVSPASTAAIRIARTSPRAVDVLYRTWVTNPLYQTAPISFRLTRSATVDLTILPATSTEAIRQYHLGRQPADQTIRLAWDGKDSQGRIAPIGAYRFLVSLADDAGNRSQALYSGLMITNKLIRVWLGKQVLTAYEGDKPVLTTLVTSGGSDLPTPTGTFEILSKSSPFVFHSPFPKGSAFWYPDTKANYAMLFDQADADFIHDAPWRAKFGPGTNGPGIPGQVYTGSHGCVETPAEVMPRLYPWTPLGTPVVITP